MSASGGAAGAQIGFLRRILPELVEKERQQPKMVPCAICGKSIPLNRAVKQDNKLICQDCHNKLGISKRASKETAQ